MGYENGLKMIIADHYKHRHANPQLRRALKLYVRALRALRATPQGGEA